VSSLLTRAGGPVIQRWKNLGTEGWKLPGWTRYQYTVWTGTKEEWSERLDNIDDEDEYNDDLEGFLLASNYPHIVGRKGPPHGITDDPKKVAYSNTIIRAPTDEEKLAFLEALYEKGGGLDLWHGGSWEGGPFIRLADKELAQFIRENQGLYLAHVSRQGRAVGSAGIEAVSEQGGRQATMAMIINAGATAHKGVDLVMTANRLQGRARETAHAQAMELIRNAGRTIRGALKAHDARVAFEQAIVGEIFDHVWGLIPGGGQIASAGKAVLKFGLKEGLKKASEDSGPSDQAEKINDEFVVTCNRLVADGHIMSADAQDAINGFEAVRR
jgi:hypothetical protein